MIFEAESLSIALNSLEKGQRSTGEYTFNPAAHDWDIPDGIPAERPGVLSLAVTLSGSSIVVEGTFRALFLAECSRCLEPVEIPVLGEVRKVFSSDPEMQDEPDVEPVSHNDGWISIFDALRESVILAMPMVPLCDKGCKGLCTVCGANLNKGECGHQVGE